MPGKVASASSKAASDAAESAKRVVDVKVRGVITHPVACCVSLGAHDTCCGVVPDEQEVPTVWCETVELGQTRDDSLCSIVNQGKIPMIPQMLIASFHERCSF